MLFENVVQTLNVHWFYGEIKQEMKNLRAVKSIMFSDMPSMSYFSENPAFGNVSGKKREKHGMRKTDRHQENERRSSISTSL